MAKIIIRRKKRLLCGIAQNHDVYFMNTHVGVLKNGGEIEVPVDIGKHTIYFKSQMKHFGKNTVFTAIVNQVDEIVELQSDFSLNGNYVVNYADNKPHIPIVQISDEAQKNNSSECKVETVEARVPIQKSTGFCCPKCGSIDLVTTTETTTKGKNFDAINACFGALLFGPLGLLCGAIGKGKQLNSATYWLCRGCGNKFKANG